MKSGRQKKKKPVIKVSEVAPDLKSEKSQSKASE